MIAIKPKGPDHLRSLHLRSRADADPACLVSHDVFDDDMSEDFEQDIDHVVIATADSKRQRCQQDDELINSKDDQSICEFITEDDGSADRLWDPADQAGSVVDLRDTCADNVVKQTEANDPEYSEHDLADITDEAPSRPTALVATRTQFRTFEEA